VGGRAVEVGLDAEVGWGRQDDLADRGRVIEHIPELAAELAEIEGPGPHQADLLGDGEQQLEPDGRRCGGRAVRNGEQHRHGRLVVGAEDPVVRVLPALVHERRLDGRFERHGVQVGAEHHRRVGGPRNAREHVARLVGLDGQAEALELRTYARGAVRLAARGALDPAELDEQVVEAPAVGLVGPH
jgi:hypothetical protein